MAIRQDHFCRLGTVLAIRRKPSWRARALLAIRRKPSWRARALLAIRRKHFRALAAVPAIRRKHSGGPGWVWRSARNAPGGKKSEVWSVGGSPEIRHSPTAGTAPPPVPGTSVRGIDLSPKELALLEYLLHHQDQVISRSEIEEHVWDSAFDSTANVVDVNVHRLRKKIDGRSEKRLLHTVRGAGYVLRSERI